MGELRMNIFQFLGKLANHRAEDKIFQLVKHLEDVSEKNISYPMWGEIKYDGNFCAVVKFRDDVAMFSRTGKHFTNVTEIEDSYHYLRDGVYVTEICNGHLTLEELSGAINPNRVEPLEGIQKDNLKFTYLVFRDFIHIDDFIRGVSDYSYSKRRYIVSQNVLPKLRPVDYVMLTSHIDSPEQRERFRDQVIGLGYEGVVYHQDVIWKAGHKNWHEMKEVKGVSFDLECIRVEEGNGKLKGKIGNLYFRFKGGKELKASLGKGWTHEASEQLFRAYQFCSHASPIGKIYKVKALQISSKGVLRNPKVEEERYDKPEADF